MYLLVVHLVLLSNIDQDVSMLGEITKNGNGGRSLASRLGTIKHS